MIIKDKLPTNTAAQGLSPTRQASEARFSRRQKAIFKHPSRWFRPHGLCPLSLSLVTLTLALCRSVSNLWAWSPVTWLYSNRKPPISPMPQYTQTSLLFVHQLGQKYNSPKVDRDQSKGCCPMRILQWHTVQKPGPHGAQQILSPPKPSAQFPSSLAPQAPSWSQTIEQTLQRTGNHCHCRWIGLWIPWAPWMTSGGPPISRSDRVPGPSPPHHPGRSSCWSRSRENTGDTTAPTSFKAPEMPKMSKRVRMKTKQL